MSRKRKNKPAPLLWAEVDLDKLRRNLKAIRSRLAGPHVETLAIVKADAYGHGMKEVARALRGEGIRFFGVASVEEAMELRRVCKKEKILVLGSFCADHVSIYADSKIIPTLSSSEDIRSLARGLKKPLRVHVKIDTGMGRLGVWHRDVRAFFEELKRHKDKILLEGVYTHFSSADHADKRLTQKQIILFNEAVRVVKSLGFAPRYLHAANSMGLARFQKAHLNLVRPGILLYGVLPRHERNLARSLRPILELRTRISFLKKIDKGRTISYGATYRAPKKTLVATLPVGYSHGFRVGFSNKGFVAVRGRICPVVGRVTMDQTVVDVGGVAGVRRWDPVTLIGKDGRAELTATGLAKILNTIPYEIFCSIHQRIPRLYKGIRA